VTNGSCGLCVGSTRRGCCNWGPSSRTHGTRNLDGYSGRVFLHQPSTIHSPPCSLSTLSFHSQLPPVATALCRRLECVWASAERRGYRGVCGRLSLPLSTLNPSTINCSSWRSDAATGEDWAKRLAAVPDHQPSPITNHQSPITNHHPPSTIHHPPSTIHAPATLSFQLSAFRAILAR
jgi:hypothetical protein